jgi:hypothetical protein
MLDDPVRDLRVIIRFPAFERIEDGRGPCRPAETGAFAPEADPCTDPRYRNPKTDREFSIGIPCPCDWKRMTQRRLVKD